MLTLEILVHNLRKTLRDNYQSVGDSMIAGGVKNYEQYKYMLGQAHAYQSMDQALTDMLNKNEDEKEEKEDERQTDNIVNFPGSTED
jgi:hypothetical protein|tara:strand:- start:439 stop:699 length:261 start_codon:yes stop_codon:yes gene_type:complete